MQVPVNVQQKTYYGDGKSRLSISISYLAEKYQEITNVRDFDLETLGSGIGGYIGIFLGYSLLQVPEILHEAWNTSWGSFILMSWLQYVSEVIMPGNFNLDMFTFNRVFSNKIW